MKLSGLLFNLVYLGMIGHILYLTIMAVNMFILVNSQKTIT